MTDLELKELVPNLGVRQTDSEQRLNRIERDLADAARYLAESARLHQENERLQQETREQMKETREEIKELGRQTDQQIKETSEQMKETDRLQRENALMLKELSQQIGKLGQKFGGFTEGMVLPSMQRVLYEHFGLGRVYPRAKVRKNGRTMELDVFAYSDGGDEVYIVEIKSRLKEEGLEQILRTIEEFRYFYPELANRKIYGILAAVDIPENVRNKVLKAGIYLAGIHNELFELRVPEGFQPRAF